MTTYLLNKTCERCNIPLPDDFQNLLCYEDYNKSIEEADERRKEVKEKMFEEAKKNPDSAVNNTKPVDTILGEGSPEPNIPSGSGDSSPNKFGIKDPNYQENPEADDKDQILANLAQFIYTHNPAKGGKGKLLWYPQRNMYNFIRNQCIQKVLKHPQYPKYVWKPKIVDVGCGSGVGANLMSQEADMVWGIDKNAFSIEFAREAFTREKNGIYYSAQVTFDQFDIMEDTRETMQFDIVTAIEVIEHIYDTDKFLRAIIKKFTKRDKRGNCHIPNEPTEFFFSSPNRNFRKIRKDKPENIFHVREWQSNELTEYLRNYFEEVRVYNQKGEPVAEDTSADEVVLLHCWHPKI